MPAGLMLAAGVGMVAFLVAIAAPGGALADGGGKCNASACKVYTEGPPSAGGQGSGPAATSSSGSAGTTVKPTVVPAKTAHAVNKQGGKDKKALLAIVSNPTAGPHRGLQTAGAASVVAPTAIGAAFDLGSGPTALLAILLASAVGLALYSGLRGWRSRREGP